VIEMRFFGGLTTEEIAEVLNVSAVTAMRDWSTARLALSRIERRIYRRCRLTVMDPERWKRIDGLFAGSPRSPTG
jgi:hypothetical protein